MAISTYSELQTAVGNWLNRGDLASRIPEFIALAEADLARRVRRKTVVGTVAITSATATVALPATCAELRSVRITDGAFTLGRPLQIVTPERLAAVRAERAGATGRPEFAAVIEGTLYLVPTPDANLSAEIIYFEALTPLGASVSTNAIFEEAPDSYLYGALTHASPYLLHDARVPTWKGLYDNAVTSLNEVRQREEQAAIEQSAHPYVKPGTLNSYEGLVRHVESFLGREDLFGLIPAFVTLGEQDIRRRLRTSTVAATLSVSASPTALPTACQELRSIRLATASPTRDLPLAIVTFEQLAEVRARTAAVTGRPTHAAVHDGNLYLAPAPDRAYDAFITYFVRDTEYADLTTALDFSAPTVRTHIAANPDLYLYATLCAAESHLGKDARIPLWQAKLDQAIAAANTERERQEQGASLRPARLPRVFG